MGYPPEARLIVFVTNTWAGVWYPRRLGISELGRDKSHTGCSPRALWYALTGGETRQYTKESAAEPNCTTRKGMVCP